MDGWKGMVLLRLQEKEEFFESLPQELTEFPLSYSYKGSF